MKKVIFIILVFCHGYSQSEAGAIFLAIPPSPTMNGLGGVGACLPSNDIYASYYNPANGFDGLDGMNYRKSKMRSMWLPNLADDIFLNYKIKSIGLIPKSHPLQVVISAHKSSLDLGYQMRTDEHGHIIEEFQSIMFMDGISIGANYKSSIKSIPYSVSFGMTQKRASQMLFTLASDDILYDYGMLISSSFKLHSDRFDFPIINKIKLSFRPTFGYSIANIADSISFGDSGDPAPKYLRTGLSLIGKISYNNYLNIFSWSGARMASDFMIDIDKLKDGEIGYQRGFGDINIYKNIILSESDSLVTIHRGDEFTFFDIYSVRKGIKVDKRGKIDLVTTGYGYRLSGLIKLLGILTNEPVYDIIYDHIDIRYDFSKYDESPGHPLNYTEFESWTISFNNLDRLLVKLYD